MAKTPFPAHNPHPRRLPDHEMYERTHATLSRSFVREHGDLVGDDLIRAWRDHLAQVIASTSPGDVFFGVAARELALAPRIKPPVVVKSTKKKPKTKTTPSTSRKSLVIVKTRRSSNAKKRARIRRSDDVCRYCMTNPAETVDHVIPLAKGGSNDELNLVGCCVPCNTAKGSKLPKDVGFTLHVPLRFYDLVDHVKSQEKP